jgi:hypothetical protein
MPLHSTVGKIGRSAAFTGTEVRTPTIRLWWVGVPRVSRRLGHLWKAGVWSAAMSPHNRFDANCSLEFRVFADARDVFELIVFGSQCRGSKRRCAAPFALRVRRWIGRNQSDS